MKIIWSVTDERNNLIWAFQWKVYQCLVKPLDLENSPPVKICPTTSVNMWSDDRKDSWLRPSWSNQTNQEKKKDSVTASQLGSFKICWHAKMSKNGRNQLLRVSSKIKDFLKNKTVIKSGVVLMKRSIVYLTICHWFVLFSRFHKNAQLSYAYYSIWNHLVHLDFFQVKKTTNGITSIWPHCTTSDGINKLKILQFYG